MIFQATLTNVFAGGYRWHVLEYAASYQGGLVQLADEINRTVRILAGDVSPILLRNVGEWPADSTAESMITATCEAMGTPMVAAYRNEEAGYEVVWVHPTETIFVVGDTLGNIAQTNIQE